MIQAGTTATCANHWTAPLCLLHKPLKFHGFLSQKHFCVDTSDHCTAPMCPVTLATVLTPLSEFSHLWREIKHVFFFFWDKPPQFLQLSQVRLQVLSSLFCFYISVLFHVNLLCFFFSFLKLICLYCWWQIFLFCKIYSFHFVNFSHCYCNKTHCDDPSINKSCT